LSKEEKQRNNPGLKINSDTICRTVGYSLSSLKNEEERHDQYRDSKTIDEQKVD
jgi:hypothetical protein